MVRRLGMKLRCMLLNNANLDTIVCSDQTVLYVQNTFVRVVFHCIDSTAEGEWRDKNIYLSPA